MSAVTKLVSLTSGFCTAALVSLHYKFGLRFRRNISFDCEDSPTNTATHLPSKFSILSQNIWCSFVYGGPQRQERLKLFVDHLSAEDSPDIICVQEMFIFALGPLLMCGDFEYLHKELTQNLGYKYHSNPLQTLPNLFGGNNGLMIYSKYKLQNCESYSFPINIRRFFSAKGWVSANINIESTANESENNKQNLSIINTHLEHSNRNYKLRQMDTLCQSIDDSNNIKYQICLGDFNICSRHTFEDSFEKPLRLYDLLQNSMHKIGLKCDLFNGVQRTLRVTEKEPHACYDHMFVNHKMESIVTDTCIMDYSDTQSDLVVSDHYGLMIEVDQNQLQ